MSNHLGDSREQAIVSVTLSRSIERVDFEGRRIAARPPIPSIRTGRRRLCCKVHRRLWPSLPLLHTPQTIPGHVRDHWGTGHMISNSSLGGVQERAHLLPVRRRRRPVRIHSDNRMCISHRRGNGSDPCGHGIGPSSG